MFEFLKNIGPTEIIVIAVILLLIFGAKAITGVARTGGQTVKEIKKIKKEFTNAINEDDSKS